MATRKTQTKVVIANSPQLWISTDGILVVSQYPRRSDSLVAAFGENEIVVLFEHVMGYKAKEDVVECILNGESFLEKGETLTVAVLQKILRFVQEWRTFQTAKAGK